MRIRTLGPGPMVTALFLWASLLAQGGHCFYFPPPGDSLSVQDRETPGRVGLRADTVAMLKPMGGKRWALWRHGYLVHVEGDFNEVSEVKSLRKTIHALTVGAAIRLGKIPSYSQKISVWIHELVGHHAKATWWHLLTQTSAFDYPYGDYPAYEPGQIWTYSDKNPKYLCDALARVFGKSGYQNDYEEVLRQCLFDPIGMKGWRISPREDGIRLHLDLEDMGRLGLLVLARGRWDGEEIVPARFVEQLERKQTDEIPVNYEGPDDGLVNLDKEQFSDAPYGFMTWVNTDTDYYPGASHLWAWGAGAGGHYLLWNREFGLVFAGVGIDTCPSFRGIPHILEEMLIGPNPLLKSPSHTPVEEITPSGRTDSPGPKKNLGYLGNFSKWAPVEIQLPGPETGSENIPNPFAILVDVLFEGPAGERLTVPGFYDGDGQGNPDGPVWKVRFSGSEEGLWTFTSSSLHRDLNGYTGTFQIDGIASDASGFYRWGRLEAVGTLQNGIRYLKFRDGPFWLKAGCDDPENFLGRAENFDTADERLEAIDYLASLGVNSFYIMTHNLGGDDKDVWPWLGSTAEIAKTHGGPDSRFDIPKLHEWRDLFIHMQRRGIVPYLILEDDSAWKDYDHARYYREIVARFGDLPAILFNLGEEHNENYSLAEALGYMQQLAHIDPYDHPRGIHNVNHPKVDYVEALQVDFTSIQTRPETPFSHNQLTLAWLDLCQQRNQRPLMVGIDEGRPEEQRSEWWETYLAGGVWEVHVMPPYDRPLSSWETVWTQLGGTRAFMESVPFWEMTPSSHLIQSGKAFCLAKPPDVYALYLPEGGAVELILDSNASYRTDWWKPTNGQDGEYENEATIGGGKQRLVAPGEGDWALRILKEP